MISYFDSRNETEYEGIEIDEVQYNEACHTIKDGRMEMTHELHYFRQQHSSWLVEDGIILMGGKSKEGLHKNRGIF